MDKLDILDSKKDKDDPEYFRKLILDKFKNIAQYFNDESFTKKYGRKNGKVNLVTLRKLACEQVYDNLASEWNRMWENEQVSDGIKKIQELTKESDPSKIAWRPTTGDISNQTVCLKRRMKAVQKETYDTFLKEKEDNIEKLKEKLVSHWDYCKEMEAKIEKYREDNDLTVSKIQDKLHSLESTPLFKKRKIDDPQS